MSFLQIDKKAITEEDGQNLIESIYAMDAPMGVPVQFLDPHSFTSRPTEGWTLRAIAKQVIKQTDDFLTQFEDAVFSKEIKRQDPTHIKFAQDIVQLKEGYSTARGRAYVAHYKYRKYAHKEDEEAYQNPSHAIVLKPSAYINGANFCESLFYGAQSKSLPGLKSQWQFSILAHELGHTVGAAEPQAETIMVVASRKAFEDNTHLAVVADARALNAVLTGMMHPERAKNCHYGWGVVEGNDYVRRLPQGVIDDMTPNQVERIKFQKFAHGNLAILNVAENLQRLVPEVSKTIKSSRLQASDLIAPLFEGARALRRENILCEEDDRILARFQLACARLWGGMPAYKQPEKYLSNRLRESELSEPMTFIPGGYIPE